MYKQSLFQVGRLLLIIASLLSGYFLIKYTLFILYPFLIALLLSFIMNPFVTFLEKRLRLPRFLATCLIVFTAITFMLSSLFIVMMKFIQGTSYLAEKIPVHFKTFVSFTENLLHTKLLPYYHKLNSLFKTLDPDQQTTINDYIQQFTAKVATSGASLLQVTFLKLSMALTHIPSSITILVITLLATLLITNDWYAIRNKFKAIIPSFANVHGRHVLLHFRKAMGGFLKAQLILITITGCIIFVSLSILHIEHALTIALLATAADLLPLVGTGIVFIPWIAYLFISGHYAMTINLLIIYMFIVISRQVIEPKVISVNIGLHPLSALFALFIGIQLWGLPGIFIAPIALVLLKALQQAGITKQLWEFIKG